MRYLFIFDFDDTLGDYSVYNTWIYRTGCTRLKPLGGLIRGSREVLDRMKEDGVDLYMLTLNIVLDEERKRRKLDRLDLDRWFRPGRVHMVRKKTPEVIREICLGRDPSDCYMVGNSYTHDIRPALKAGINAIFIPRPFPKRLMAPLVPRKRGLFVIRDMNELMELYSRIRQKG